MSKNKQNAVLRNENERPTIPSPRPIKIGLQSDTREIQTGKRSLREAVIRLTRKVEALGVDVSDVTELLGIDEP